MSFLEIETAIESRLSHVMGLLNQRRSRREATFTFEDECCEAEESEGKDESTQVLHMQKKLLIQLQEHFERYCIVLPMFGFNSGKYDINLIKKYLLPVLVEDKDIEPIVIKKANQYVSFKCGDVQLLDILNFLGGATNLDSFHKAYKTEEAKSFFPYESFDDVEKLSLDHFSPYECFYSKLCNCNPFEKEYLDYEKLVQTGLSQESAMQKLRLTRPPLTGEQNYTYLVEVWKREKMTTFKDFLRWYNSKDVIATLEAIQKMIDFYHKKELIC